MSSPRSNLENQVIALAGVAQAARLVDQISKSGSYPLEFLEPSIHSLFEFDPEGVEIPLVEESYPIVVTIGES